MDVISISAYFRLVKSESAAVPGLKQTRALFEKKVKKIQRWRRREGLNNMDVLVAEVGFQSKGAFFFSVFLEPQESYSQLIIVAS